MVKLKTILGCFLTFIGINALVGCGSIEATDSWEGTLTISANVGADPIMETRPGVTLEFWEPSGQLGYFETQTPKDSEGVYLACLFEPTSNDATSATIANSDCFVHPDSQRYGYDKLAGAVTKSGESIDFQLTGETYTLADDGTKTGGAGTTTISFSGSR